MIDRLPKTTIRFDQFLAQNTTKCETCNGSGMVLNRHNEPDDCPDKCIVGRVFNKDILFIMKED